MRVLQGRVLAKADRQRGRFRSLLLSVTTHVILDRLRKRRETPVEDLETESRESEQEFDQEWALHLTERALNRMRDEGSPYYDVLEGHLSGQPQNRNKLWIARKKLASQIRREVAYTCATPIDVEAEMAYLGRYLRPRGAKTRGAKAKKG